MADQPFGFQLLEGLPDRSAADVEPIRYVLLDDGLPWLQLIRHDRIQQIIVSYIF